MSCTTLYRLGNNQGEIGDVRNSWRGGMYVWNDIAQRYLGLERFEFNDEIAARIWNAYKYSYMSKHDLIVLLSTLDKAVVGSENAAELIEAFYKYARSHPRCSLAEQAGLIRDANIQPGEFVAWQQTSVGEFWGYLGEEEEEEDESIWYNPLTDTGHFDIIEEANSILRDKQTLKVD